MMPLDGPHSYESFGTFLHSNSESFFQVKKKNHRNDEVVFIYIERVT